MKFLKKLKFSFGKKRNNRVQPGQINTVRTRHTSVFFYVLFIVLAGRAVIIHLFPSSKDNLQNMADRQYQQKIELAPYRGIIYDRKGVPLAISIRKPSLAVNPRLFDPTPKEITELAKLLKVSKNSIKEIADKKSYFSWLKRKVGHNVSERVKRLEINGLYELMEPSRYYPSGKAAANLIGYVGIDNSGMFGLEQRYNSFLQGQSNKVISAKDARGKNIFLNSDKATPAQSGNNIHLTIDAAIQEIAQEALEKWVKESGAKGGFALVNDPHTGRILAMANYPTFDPNHQKIDMKDTLNQAIANVFEPGSTMKPFVVAAALEKKLVSFDQKHNCEKSGAYKVGKRNWIHDDHPKEILTTNEVLVHSSNICTFKIAEMLGQKSLFQTYKNFGFASDNFMLGLMGEQTGRLSKWEKWKPIEFATVAFGQGLIATTGLEMSRAYSAVANGGSLITPFVVEKITTESGKIVQSFQSQHIGQVISPDVTLMLRKSMEEVVTGGTASLAATKDFTTGGKTGTAEKVDSETKAYSSTKRTASFAGFAPVMDPHIVVFVVIDEPAKKPYYGGKWAAPAFSEIVQKTLKYLNVAADKQDLKVSEHEQDSATEKL